VYPELAGLDPKSGKKAEPGALTKTLDQMLADAKIEQTTINRLGESMKGLTDNVNKIGTIGDAAMATKNYADKAQEAAGAMTKLNASYTSAISAIEKIGAVGDTSKKYQDTLASVTQNMSSLNSIYEAELKETNNQVKKLNDAYGQFTKTIANLGGAEESTRMMKDEFNKLGKNLSTLNNIYGNMLSAMSAPRS
jgi:gliding motility-associated protein GldL